MNLAHISDVITNIRASSHFLQLALSTSCLVRSFFCMSSFSRWYKALSPRSRMILGGGLIAWGLIGNWATDAIGTLPGWQVTDEDRKKVWDLFGSPRITMVEREDVSSRKGRKDG